MKQTIIIFLCLLLFLSGCEANTPLPTHVIFEADQDNSQVNCVVPSKKVAQEIAEAVFSELPVSSSTKKFEVQDIVFDDSNDTWIVYFWQNIPLKDVLRDGQVSLGYDLYIVIQKKDGKILSIGLEE